MDGADFIRRVRKLGRKRGIAVRADKERGKGSHAVVTYGERWTIVPAGTLKAGIYRKICKDLGIDPDEL